MEMITLKVNQNDKKCNFVQLIHKLTKTFNFIHFIQKINGPFQKLDIAFQSHQVFVFHETLFGDKLRAEMPVALRL